jgi:hypothetical protein
MQPGPAPKVQRTRERDNADWTMLPPEGNTDRYPALPDVYGDPPVAFLDETRQWYAEWATSPQATMFEDSDWRQLRMVAKLVDSYNRAPRHTVLARIQVFEREWGATESDRRRLRWRIAHKDPVSGPAPEPEPVSAAPGPDAASRPRRRRRGGDPRLTVVDGG